MSRLVTLTTDFGLLDHYVAVMKAVILGETPAARLVDISHDIPPQDVMAGAWVLRNAYPHFPTGTVHLVVVDPGVGTDRKPIIVELDDQLFVGPDNGVFSLLTARDTFRAWEISDPEIRHAGNSSTFHGRDLFAPVAARLAAGISPERLGHRIEELVTYRWARPIADPAGIQGWIVHIDRFGNLISNIPSEMIQETVSNHPLKIYVGNTIMEEISTTYASVEEGDPLACIGSSGMLEIAVNKGNAAEMLGVVKGAQISLVTQTGSR